MTIKVTSVGHCCACSVTCMHIGGPWYCDSHKPHGPTMPFVPVADSAEVQRLRAELALERMERAQADAMLAKARAATEIAEHERDGVREELARMAGDLDDACSERDRLRSVVRRVREIRDDWYRKPGWSEDADRLDAALDGSTFDKEEGAENDTWWPQQIDSRVVNGQRQALIQDGPDKPAQWVCEELDPEDPVRRRCQREVPCDTHERDADA